MPGGNVVTINAVSPVLFPGGAGWPDDKTSANVGLGLGSEAGELASPLSFDVGPDGRIYVANFGNRRIQKFAP